jgi:hypothetical protein
VVTFANGLVAEVLIVWNVAPPFVCTIGIAGGFRRLTGGGGADRRCGGDTGAGASLRMCDPTSGWDGNAALELEDAMGDMGW